MQNFGTAGERFIPKNSGLPKLLHWSHALRSDQFMSKTIDFDLERKIDWKSRSGPELEKVRNTGNAVPLTGFGGK